MADPTDLFARVLGWLFRRPPAGTEDGGRPIVDAPPTDPDRRTADPADLFARVPVWLPRPLPANAEIDERLEAEIDALSERLPEGLRQIGHALDRVAMYREYDSAANRAGAHVWLALDRVLSGGSLRPHLALIEFASRHMVGRARDRILRRLAKAPEFPVRRAARGAIERLRPDEVALPSRKGGDWDATGWLHGIDPHGVARHRTGTRVQEKHGLPVLGSVGALHGLLGIKTPAQLGYFLLASHEGNGPYLRFTVPKRDGAAREICAPKSQLRGVQRQILRRVLDRVPVHPAAHGFVAGRSTVTNAEAHLGAEVLLKFDLTDFFPTIHYNRVVGLFASLGYPSGNGLFGTDDRSRQVAPTLARLCTYAHDPRAFMTGLVPQGAPTSPALSNLVCRGLDARLDGLARRNGGAYTRYADDLTFSFPADPPAIGRFRWWVDQVCHQEGFFVNRKKSRVIRRSQRQTVTGIVTNDALRVPRDQRRRFRATLHNCRLHGLESQSRGRPGFADYLRGFASYIHMVDPEEGAALLKQVDELLGARPGAEGRDSSP